MADKSDSNSLSTSELKTASQLAPSSAQTPSQNQSIGQMRSSIQQQVATTSNPQVLPNPIAPEPIAEPLPETEPAIVPGVEPVIPITQPLQPIVTQSVVAPQQQQVVQAAPVQPVVQPIPQLPVLQPEVASVSPSSVAVVPPTKRRGKGCLRIIPRLGCRTLGCFGCFLPLVLLFLAALFLLIRPAQLWEPFKELLNTEVSTQAASQIPQSPNNEANAQLLSSLINQASSSKKLTLKQNELAEIFASRIELARGMYLEISDDQLILYRNLESQGEPLWLIAYFTLDDGSFTLSKLKISSVELPEFVRNIARDGLQSGFDFVNLQDPGDLFSKLIQVGQQPADVAAIELTAGAVIIELK